ncbi:APC family permease [Haloactinospora alba]|nr:APC family permease [Haloactinospora alba]
MTTSSGSQGTPARVMGTVDAATIGAGAMIGAGVFAVFAPAADEAGAWLPVALLIAGLVAYCNATSSARLAARHPQSGGSYVYGRERLGELWGYLAGWAFIVGKTASCAAMAMTFAAYAWPAGGSWAAAGAVVVLAGISHRGIRATALVTRFLLVVVLVVLGVSVAVSLGGGAAQFERLSLTSHWPGFFGLLGAAGMLFFAFAGYARIATLGAEVRRPERTIPRAISVALGFVLLVYLLVGVSALTVLGHSSLSESSAPLVDTVAAAGWPSLGGFVRVGAAFASLGALLTLLLGVSRTVHALAGDRNLPWFLARVHGRFAVPYRAQWAVALVVCVLVLLVDLPSAIGFSAFGVLVYYAIANASALRLGPEENRPPLLVPVGGLTGCVVLAFSLPLTSVVPGVTVLLAGGLAWLLTRFLHRRGWAGGQSSPRG